MTSTKYPTDLTDAQWDKLLPYLPEPSPILKFVQFALDSSSLIKCLLNIGRVCRGVVAEKALPSIKAHRYSTINPRVSLRG